MRIYYVPAGDILVVELSDLRESPGAAELAPGVYLDRTDEGKVLALEITGATRFYPREQLEALGPAPVTTFTTAEVARFLGISERAVQAAITRERLEATKVGRDWLVTADAIAAYSRGRKATGPRPRAIAESAPRSVARATKRRCGA
jgi:excisionase family DNA binding protein